MRLARFLVFCKFQRISEPACRVFRIRGKELIFRLTLLGRLFIFRVVSVLSTDSEVANVDKSIVRRTEEKTYQASPALPSS